MNTASRLVAATIAITAPYYLYNLTRSISSVPSSHTRTGTPPPSFLKSKTHLGIVNPRVHKGLIDSRSITFKLPPTRQSWSDEQILATFVQGYFGGWVFTPERRALGLLSSLLRRRVVGFSGESSLVPIVAQAPSVLLMHLSHPRRFPTSPNLVLQRSLPEEASSITRNAFRGLPSRRLSSLNER